MRLRALLLYSLLLVACGPEKVDSTAIDSADSTAAATSNEPNTAGGEDAEGFGFACVRLLQADGQSFVTGEPENDGDRFAGTAEIRLTMRYEPCLVDYYTAHPGPDSAIINAWRPRLCSEPVADPLVACEAGSYTLHPDVMMTIAYSITDPAQIAGRTLLWGPGPLAETADCPEGQEPAVKLGLTSDLTGFDADGFPLWSARSWGESLAIMKHDTQDCIEVEIW